MRLTLVIHGMSAGGAERVMQVLANGWAAAGHAVTLITLDRVEDDFYACDPRVRRVGLGLKADSAGPLQALTNNLARVAGLRRAIKDSLPRVVVSFTDQTNVLTILASRGLGLPVIVCEHTDPHRHRVPAPWAWLRRRIYPRADAVVGVTRAAEEFARGFVKNRPVLTLPNPIAPPPPPADLPRLWPEGPTVVAMGRLDPGKNFALLIRAFALARANHPQWRLVILGEGPERLRLETLATELDLGPWVHLPGRVADPLTHLRRAEIFALSSDYEGFPMSLLEAMSCGLAVVATDCGTGVREIINPGVDGLIVPRSRLDPLAQALESLMADPVRRATLAQAAPRVCARFSLERVLGLWDQLLRQVVPPRP